MAGFKFDHEKEGLSKTLKEYEEIAQVRVVLGRGRRGVGEGLGDNERDAGTR